MPTGNITEPLLDMPCQHRVFYGFDPDHTRLAIVERRINHELAADFVALGTVEVHRLKLVACPFGLATRVPAPTRVSEAEVLATTILGDELRAFLLGRAV